MPEITPKSKPQAIILAAGQGTRLAPLTENLPKTLLRVNGEWLLNIIVERVLAVGITDIIIAIGHASGEIKRHVSKYFSDVTIKFVENPIYRETNSTYSLWLTKDVVAEDFITINADTIFNRGILAAMVDADYEICMSIDDTMAGPLPEDNMKVTIVDGLIRDASKVVPPELTHGDALGVYRFRGNGAKALFAKLDELVKSNIIDQLFTFAVKSIMHEYDVYPVSARGMSWIEIDDHKDLADAQAVVAAIHREEAGAT